MGDKFLSASGRVEWRPDATTVRQLNSPGSSVTRAGWLCTACLVGDWPMTQLRVEQVLCGDCAVLVAEVGRRLGVETGIRVARHKATAYQAQRLAPVFATAVRLGLTRTELRGPDQEPVQVVDVDDLRRPDLLPTASALRLERLAEWLTRFRRNNPNALAIRDAILADVDGWAAWTDERHRHVHQAHARQRLDDVLRSAAGVPGQVARAAVDVVKLHWTRRPTA